MNWRSRLFSNIFFRNVIATFGGRPTAQTAEGEITPYFHYKIGSYQNDHFLYFSQQPYPLRYKNEIFNKLEEYSGHDLVKYLEFHYAAFSDKIEFLEFLASELSERLKRTPRRASLLSAREWTIHKRDKFLSDQRSSGRREPSEASLGVPTQLLDEISQNLARCHQDFHEKMKNSFTSLLAESEQSMRSLTNAFATGNIELNNRLHEDRLIQLLILIQQIKAPGRPEQLFKKINATDIAAILHLHFQPFHESKLNTVQRKVSEQAEQLRPSQAKTKRLVDALEAFFFS